MAQEATGGAEGQTVASPDLEARRINEVLLGRGLTQFQANEWWNVSNPDLGGKTPNQVWLSEETPTEAIIVAVRDAAFADVPN